MRLPTSLNSLPRFVLTLVCVPLLASGNLLLHSPRGSNNRLNEITSTVHNTKRLFNSQNDISGGYPVGDNCDPVCSLAAEHRRRRRHSWSYNADAVGAGAGVMEYYVDSILPLDFTASAGTPPFIKIQAAGCVSPMSH